jgi:regulator of RNase E activity RraA
MDVFAALRAIRTPIIYDTIERLNLRPRSQGYLDASIRCMFPGLGAIAGYACTGRIAAELPPTPEERVVPWREVWSYVGRSRRPSIMVVQDMDQPPARGCAWGDVAASIFTALGCTGAITNGGVRDLREVEALKFPLFASSPVVGHAYVRYVAAGTPVKLGGQVIHPGDLLHADEHGVVIIPPQVPLEDLVRQAREFMASERTVIDYCSAGQFDLDELCRQMDAHDRRASAHMNASTAPGQER